MIKAPDPLVLSTQLEPVSKKPDTYGRCCALTLAWKKGTSAGSTGTLPPCASFSSTYLHLCLPQGVLDPLVFHASGFHLLFLLVDLVDSFRFTL
jgi:hypothetical protein